MMMMMIKNQWDGLMTVLTVSCILIVTNFNQKYFIDLINRPVVAGAVLQTPSSFIHSTFHGVSV